MGSCCNVGPPFVIIIVIVIAIASLLLLLLLLLFRFPTTITYFISFDLLTSCRRLSRHVARSSSAVRLSRRGTSTIAAELRGWVEVQGWVMSVSADDHSSSLAARLSGAKALQRPKSESLMWPFLSKSKLSGLMSLQTKMMNDVSHCLCKSNERGRYQRSSIR